MYKLLDLTVTKLWFTKVMSQLMLFLVSVMVYLPILSYLCFLRLVSAFSYCGKALIRIKELEHGSPCRYSDQSRFPMLFLLTSLEFILQQWLTFDLVARLTL